MGISSEIVVEAHEPSGRRPTVATSAKWDYRTVLDNISPSSDETTELVATPRSSTVTTREQCWVSRCRICAKRHTAADADARFIEQQKAAMAVEAASDPRRGEA